MKNEIGVLYVAVGNRYYVDQALISKRSIERFCDIQFAIVTDLEIDSSEWDHVIPYNVKVKLNANNYMIPKLYGLKNTPFVRTLFLDSDTFILSDISTVFGLLDRFDGYILILPLFNLTLIF